MKRGMRRELIKDDRTKAKELSGEYETPKPQPKPEEKQAR